MSDSKSLAPAEKQKHKDLLFQASAAHRENLNKELKGQADKYERILDETRALHEAEMESVKREMLTVTSELEEKHA